MIGISFKPWSRFKAKRDKKVTSKWLRSISRSAEQIFRAGIIGSHSGVLAKRKDGTTFRRSAPRTEFPARDSGRLLRSLRSRSNQDEVIIGTGMPYSKWLREGTRKMARRKMSDNALVEGRKSSGRPLGWVSWIKGR